MLNYIRVGNNFINLKNAYIIKIFTTQFDMVIIEVEYAHSIKQFPCEGMTEAEIAAILENALCVGE